MLEEISNYYPKNVLMEIYEIATKERFSFLYINLSATKVEDVFWLRFESLLVPSANVPLAPASNAILQ